MYATVEYYLRPRLAYFRLPLMMGVLGIRRRQRLRRVIPSIKILIRLRRHPEESLRFSILYDIKEVLRVISETLVNILKKNIELTPKELRVILRYRAIWEILVSPRISHRRKADLLTTNPTGSKALDAILPTILHILQSV